MNFLEQLGISTEYVILGLAAIIVLLFINQIVLGIRISKQKKRLSKFMEGEDAKSLEEIIKSRLDDIENIKTGLTSVEGRVSKLEDIMLTVYRKSAIVKYDAFKEMGGKLSFALALLNENNNGFLINSMHSSREGCFTYVKEIIDGKSFVTLADEEKQALEEAINSTNFME
ncbi:MAG: DUF4446 family protein [Clostridia bacterium]|nr:DUF4446 family protein [Clostridia bacterium]